MPHTQVVTARRVLSTPDKYPEVVLSYARAVASWDDDRREAIVWLWNHRSIFKSWILSRRGETRQKQNIAASRQLAAMLSKEDCGQFHRCAGYIGKAWVKNAMLFGRFQALVGAVECEDIEKMHDYFACVNAGRLDHQLEDVRFLTWVTGNLVCEVIAWRFLQSMK